MLLHKVINDTCNILFFDVDRHRVALNSQMFQIRIENIHNNGLLLRWNTQGIAIDGIKIDRNLQVSVMFNKTYTMANRTVDLSSHLAIEKVNKRTLVPLYMIVPNHVCTLLITTIEIWN